MRTDLAEIAQAAEAAGAAGVQHLIVSMPQVWDVQHLDLIGREVIPVVERVAA